LIRLAYLAMWQDGRNQFTLTHFDEAYISIAFAAAREVAMEALANRVENIPIE
jgi:hypothetical protein